MDAHLLISISTNLDKLTGSINSLFVSPCLARVLIGRKDINIIITNKKDVETKLYSRLPITQTFRGNKKRFELQAGVRVTGG